IRRTLLPGGGNAPHSRRVIGLAGLQGAGGGVAGVETLLPGRLALLGRAVVAGAVGAEVADRQRSVERLLDVAVLELVFVLGGLCPAAGVAVGLELELHRRARGAVLVELAELGLDLVAVLVGDD